MKSEDSRAECGHESGASSETHRGILFIGLCCALGIVGCGATDGVDDASGFAGARDLGRDACAERDPLKNAYFGATHIHTAYSFDAWSWDVRNGPDQAYAFASGQSVRLPPLDAEGVGRRTVQLARPLDFAATTDHAELLGEVFLCTDARSSAYDTMFCRRYRGEADVEVPPGLKFIARLFPFLPTLRSVSPRHAEEVCGEDGARCTAEVPGIWKEIQESAERWYDRSSECRFTTFVAYEYSALPEGSNLHRNVIFRNATVPDQPISYVDEPTRPGLWNALERTCRAAGTGCDVLAIPHNSNWSNGRMFIAEYPGAETRAEQAEQAQLRRDLEPLVEIYQHKGDSECRNGLFEVMGGPDELCNFEKLIPPTAEIEDCREGTGAGGSGGEGCMSRLSFVRYALTLGLREADRIGVNPYQMGIIAASDTHNGLGGAVEERGYKGHMGAGDATPIRRLSGQFARWSPGGLAGVWAEENSREALFDAMRRRETFGTSGPRIVPRFFAGWGLPDDLCEDPDLVARGYEEGVPMGGELPPPPPGATAPVFVATALRDAGTPDVPGGLLQRVQIVKSFVDDRGRFQQRIYDVAGSADNGAAVDLDTCEPTGPGLDVACGVWRDPAFEAGRRAVYYARVVENPSCRYSAHQCLALAPGDRPSACSNPAVPKVIQERAWTSPIWYNPPPSGSRSFARKL